MTSNETRLIEALEDDMSAMAVVALEVEKLNRLDLRDDLLQRVRVIAKLIREVRR